MSKKKLEVHQPDDRFFKGVMKKVENSRAYLENFYASMAALSDLDTLKLEQTSFITKEFKSFDADIIYSCAFKDSKEKFYCCFLFENKSIADDSVVLQVGAYQLIALYQMQKDKNLKLKPIIPLVFYNGKQDWQPKTVKALFKEHPYYEQFQAWLPDIPIHFLNISKRPIEELLAIKERSLRSTMLSMASRFKQDQLLEYVAEIFEIGEDKEDFERLVAYFFGILERSPKAVRKRFKEIEFTTKTNVMSTLEQMIEEGRVEGRLEGIMEGRIEGKAEGKVEGKVEERISKVVPLLNLLLYVPTMTNEEIAAIHLITEEKIALLRESLATNDMKTIKQAIKIIFLEDLPLNEAQESELETIITQYLSSLN